MRQKAVIAFATSVHWVPWKTKDKEMGDYVSKSPDVIGFLKSAVLPFLCSTCFGLLISDQFFSVCWPCVCEWNSFKLHVDRVDSAQMNISASSLVVAAADCPVKVWWTTKKLAEVALHQEWRWLHSSKLVQVKQQTTVELEGPHPQPVRSVWHATLRKSRVHNLECQDLEPTKTPDTWPNVLLAH